MRQDKQTKMYSSMISTSQVKYLEYKKVEIEFCGNIFWLYSDGSCFHEQSKTLIVADLHLEKAFSQSSAALLPGYDTKETLTLLEAALMRNEVQNCIFLGDSFHNAGSAQSLAKPYKEKLVQLSKLKHFKWVLGNHDPLLPDFLPGERCQSTYIDSIELRHQPKQNENEMLVIPKRGQIIGHYHPKAKLRLRASNTSGKCFIFDQKRMILPAFGVYTGGLNITSIAISSLFSGTPAIYFCHKTKLYRIRDITKLRE